MKIISKSVKDGKMLSITLRLDGTAEEARIYKAALKGVKCPKCGKEIDPPADHMDLIVTDPLSTKLGLDTARMSTVCSCGNPIRTTDEFEVSPFKAAAGFLKQLRAEWEKRQLAERRSKNG